MDIELIRQAAIFADLDDAELETVLGVCEELELRHGEYVFHERDEGDRLYLIVDGAVRISRNVPGTGEEALTVLRKGACFGEMAVVDASRRSTDAIVHSRSRLLTINRADFESLLSGDPALGNKILRAVVRLLCQRLRATNDNLQSVLVMAMF